MKLVALIQKGALARVGSATSATSATEASDQAGSVATVADVAVANPGSAHYRWQVILSDGSAFEVCCLPELTAAEMHDLYYGATVQPLQINTEMQA